MKHTPIIKALIKKTYNNVIAYFDIFIHRFIIDHCPHVAAALTFTSLLALVPLLAISVTIINQVPAAQDFLAVGQEYLFQIFAPEFGDEIKSYLLAFVTKTQSLTKIGIIFVAITALLTLDTVEKTLNRIWRVKKSRNILMRFSIYFVVLTLGPVLIGISLSVTTYLSTLKFFSDTISIQEIGYNYLAILPLITTTFAFTLIYKIVPNEKVPLAQALIGGIVAALLFELSKRGFAYFITSFSTYQLIYGALAAIPLTLIWFYVSWLVVLIGAEVTASGTDFLNLKFKDNLNRQVDLCIAIKVLGEIGFLPKTNGVKAGDIMKNESHIPDELINNALLKLEEHGLIKQQDYIWLLAREKSSYYIQELLSLTSPCCGDYLQYKPHELGFNQKLEKALTQLRLELNNSSPILLQNIYD
ncbi:Ribonuclease BN [hydrothermal vent metagenome]|uniref:Ribonuclease BN n=1 Tax=hydrothermal vent metagenome TaxID=652676 RepID=A0A3B0ZDI8_9ZZZZ